MGIRREIFGLGFLVVAVSTLGVTLVFAGGTSVHENFLNGFSVEYPDDWELIELEDPIITAMIVPPTANPEEPVDAISMILIEQLSLEIDLFDYSELAMENLESSLGNFKLIEDYEVALDNIPAKKIKFSGLNELDVPVTGTYVWTIKDNKAFLLLFMADSTEYTKYNEVGRLIEDSFKFKQDAPKIIIGDYNDAELGLKVEFPTGWPAIEVVIESIEDLDEVKLVAATDPKFYQTLDENDFTTISVFSLKNSEIDYNNNFANLGDSDCKMPNEVKIIQTNQMKSMEIKTACFDETLNLELKSLMYFFATKENTIISMYSTSTESAYDDNLSKFEKFNDSLQIENTIDLSKLDDFAEIFNAPYIAEETILVGESAVDIIFSSSDTITQIDYDEESQKLSIMANSGGKTEGFLDIGHISKILDPPYEVLLSNPSSEFFLIDDTTTNSFGISISFISSSEEIVITGKQKETTNENTTESQIPDWVRGNAEWWAQGAIGDSDFVSGIQYLIKEGIMTIPETAQGSTSEDSQEIPAWIKNNADWWAQGLISDDDFVKGIQFLIENGIMAV